MAHNCAAVNPDFRWIERPGAFPLLQDRMLWSQRNWTDGWGWWSRVQTFLYYFLKVSVWLLWIMRTGTSCTAEDNAYPLGSSGRGTLEERDALYIILQKTNANELRSNIFYCSFKNVPLFREKLRARKFTYLRKKVRVDLNEYSRSLSKFFQYTRI